MTTIAFLGNKGCYKASIAAYLSTGALFEKGSIEERACNYYFGCQGRRFLICDLYPTKDNISYMEYPNCNIFFVFNSKLYTKRDYLDTPRLIEDIFDKTNDNAIIVEMNAPRNIEEVHLIAQTVLRVLSSLPLY